MMVVMRLVLLRIVHQNMIIVLNVNHGHNFKIIFPLFQPSNILLVYSQHLAFNQFLILIFNLSFNATNDRVVLWVINDLFPIFFSDSEPFKLLSHSVVEKSLFVESHIKYSNDTSLGQPEHVFWLTANLETYFYGAMENEKDLLNFFDTFKQNGFGRYFPGFKLGQNSNHELPVHLIIPTIVGFLLKVGSSATLVPFCNFEVGLLKSIHKVCE